MGKGQKIAQCDNEEIFENDERIGLFEMEAWHSQGTQYSDEDLQSLAEEFWDLDVVGDEELESDEYDGVEWVEMEYFVLRCVRCCCGEDDERVGLFQMEGWPLYGNYEGFDEHEEPLGLYQMELWNSYAAQQDGGEDHDEGVVEFECFVLHRDDGDEINIVMFKTTADDEDFEFSDI